MEGPLAIAADPVPVTPTALREISEGLLMKFELDNPAGSHKWRAARNIIRRGIPGLEQVTFVSTAGTGAHMTGIARVLKREGLLAEAILVEPEGCDSRTGTFVDHALEGIAVGVVPPLLDWDLIGGHATVSHADMQRVQTAFIHEQGYMIGNTSAACLKVSRDVLAGIGDRARHKVLTLAYDHALWYL